MKISILTSTVYRPYFKIVKWLLLTYIASTTMFIHVTYLVSPYLNEYISLLFSAIMVKLDVFPEQPYYFSDLIIILPLFFQSDGCFAF